jgi:hypothetical protein
MNSPSLKSRLDRSAQRAVEKSTSPHKATSQRTGHCFCICLFSSNITKTTSSLKKVVISTGAHSAQWRNPLLHTKPPQPKQAVVFAFACSLPTSPKNDIPQKPRHLDRRRRSCRRSGEIPAFRFSNRNALQRATESTESIDTHDKMETDTNQSGASRTAPFNAPLTTTEVQT